ncbi:hypothetical protein ABZ543_08350 [Streptomyces roseifaciens]
MQATNTNTPGRTAWPSLDGIETGLYAVPDPDHPGETTHWERKRTAATDTLDAWPAEAWYGPPVPHREDFPLGSAARRRFLAAWSSRRAAYMHKIVEAILADPQAAARRHAQHPAAPAAVSPDAGGPR